MPLIKRYPNRKLYDTETKKYITLEGIANLIRQGKKVTVIDHSSGQDLTAVTLSQIIFEQEKKQRGFLPRSVLTGLIQAGGDTLGNLRRTLADSLGLFRHVEIEIERRIHLLIQRGELDEKQGLSLLDKLLSLGRQPDDEPGLSEQALEQLLQEQEVPTRDDINRIVEQLDALADKLDQIKPNAE